MAQRKKAPAIQPAVLGVADAAAYLGLSRRTLERMAAASDLPYVRISEGRRGFRRTDLDDYLASRVTYARTDPAA